MIEALRTLLLSQKCALHAGQPQQRPDLMPGGAHDGSLKVPLNLLLSVELYICSLK